MAYFAPYIDSTGIHYPSYADIRDYLIEQAQSIWGSDIYLDPDSQDYEDISLRALSMYDTMQMLEQAYLNQSPRTAVGVGLDIVTALNGLSRKSASRSMCDVTLTGTVGTVITGGIVTDINGYLWNLPSPITISYTGTLSVTAVCQTEGAIQAAAATLTTIATPTAGWTLVTNPGAATPGQPIERDPQLKARQAISTALPSKTMLAGTKAAIASLTGVTRSEVYENYTSEVDNNGLAPHSIWAVVEGGDDDEIAHAIYESKGFCGLNGTTEVMVTDETAGVTESIRFSRPGYTPIYVIVTGSALTGYTSAMGDAIKAAIVAYLNGLQIGEDVIQSTLYGPTLGVMENLSTPNVSITSIKIGTEANPTQTNNIAIAFDHAAQCTLAHVTVNIS